MDLAGLKRRDLQALCKQHGLPAGGSNAALATRLADASVLPGEEVATRKGCLKRLAVGNDLREPKKVSFALEESRGRRRQSQVFCSPNTVAKTRGRSKAVEMRAACSPDAEAGRRGRGQHRRAEVDGVSADADSVAAEVGAGAPVRRSRRNLVDLGDVDAVEVGETVAIVRKRKRRSQEKEEKTAVSAQVGVPCRVTRMSTLSGAAILSPLAVEKKRGRRKASDTKNELDADDQVAEAQDLAEAELPAIVESKRSKGKAEDCDPVVQKSAKVEAPVRITRSRAAAATVTAPIAVENKWRRTMEDVQTDVVLPPVLEVPRNDAPVTRTLRNRTVHVNSNAVEGTRVGQELKNKRQPSRPATRRNQQLASSMEEEDQEQVPAPSKCPLLRRTKRNNFEPSIADSETNKSSSLPVEANNAKVEDVEKQPTAKGPVRRLTRQSVVSAMLGKEDKDLVAEKGPEPEAHVTISKRKSFVLVKNMQDASEEFQNAKGDDVSKQPTVKEPARRSTRKSVVSAMLEEDDKNLIAEKSHEAHVRTLTQKSGVPVKVSKGDREETQNAKGEDAAKRLAVKKPVRRSTRKSVASGMLEKEENDLIAAKKPEAHDKRSVRKSVLPNEMLNKENWDHIKMARNEVKSGDEEKQLKVKGPVRLSRRSVATVVSEKENKDLREETKSEIPVTRSTRKSVAPNAVEKGDVDHTEMVGREPSGVESQNLKARAQITERDGAMATSEIKLQIEVSVQNSLHRSTHKSSSHKLSDDNKTNSGTNKDISCEKTSNEVLKLRKHRRSSVEISSRANDSWNVVDSGGQKFQNQSNTQTPNKTDGKGTKREMATSKGRPTKRRRATVPEEVMSVEEAKCEGVVIREAICNTVTHGNESSRRIEANCQVNATGKELSSDPSLVTLHEEFIVQTLHNVISGSESADAQNPEIYPSHGRESSDQSKQTQGYYAIQTDDGLLSDTRIEELDQSSSITEVLPQNGIVSEDKTLTDGGDINFGDKSIQIVNASSYEVDLETLNTSFRRSATAALIMDAEAPMVENTTVNAETKQSDAEAALTVLSFCDGITVTVTEPQFAGQKDSQGVSTDASESVPPISDSKQESHSAEQSIQGADMGKYLSKGIKGNPLSPNLHSDGADADSILPALDAAKGSSSDISHSSFGLDFLYAEERKGSSSSNDTNTVVEVDYGSKPSACVTPSFCMESDCRVECKNVQPLGYDADKTLDVGQGVAQEEFIAANKSNDEHVAVEFDLKTKSDYEDVGLYMESNCILAEKNTRLVAESRDDEQAVIQVHQDVVQEGTLEKSSLCSAAPEFKHECRLPEEVGLHSIRNKRCSPCAEQSPLGLQSLFSHESLDDSMEHGALASATSHTESGVDQLKDCHVKCTVEKTTVPQPISHHDTHLVTEIDDCMYMSQQNNGIEGLPEVSHEELVSSCLSGFSVDANHRKEVINSAELTSKGESNRNIFHFEDLNASCEKSDVNVSVHSDCGISGTVLSCSLHAPDTYNDVVRLGSNLAQLESADILVKLIGSSDNEVQHPSQKEHCIEDGENQVASTSCTNDIMEVATAKCIESRVVLLTAEGSENLKDGQLNSKLKSAQTVGSDSNYNKDISNTLDDGSVAGIVSERNSPDFTLPKDYPTGRELLDDFSVKKSLEESAISGGKNVSNAGTVKNPSFDSAMSEHKGVLFEEVVHGMKNYVGTCPSNPKELLMELQSMSSKENIEESERDNLALPVEERSELQDRQLNSVLESAKVVESNLSCNKDARDILDNGSVGIVYQNFLFGDKSDSRVNTMNNYVETCLSNPRELLMELQSSSNETVENLGPRDNIAFSNTEGEADESTICHVENLADTVVLSEPGMYLGLSQDCSRDEGKQGCMSVSLRDDEEGFLKSNHLKDTSAYLSEDAHNMARDFITAEVLCEKKKERESIWSSNCDTLHENSHSKGYGIYQSSGRMHVDEISSKLSSCDAEVLCQDRVEECHKVNEDEVNPADPEKDMSEAAPFERMESTIMLDGEGEEYSFSCDKNTSKIVYPGSVKNSMFMLPEAYHLDSCQKQESLDVLSVPKCPEESTDCQDESVLGPGTRGLKCTTESSTTQLTSHIGASNQDQYNENNKHQTTPAFPASGMSEAALIKRSGRVIDVVLRAGSPALRDEHRNSKLESPKMEEHNCVIDNDTSSLFHLEWAGKSKASNLPKDIQLDPSFPNDYSAPRSPEKSMIFQNDNNVSGSEGTCQRSRRRAMDEISTKLQNFEVSSAVKGSFIAMSASRPMEPLSGRPRDH